MNHRFSVVTLGGIILVSGCALGPDYQRPDLDLPAQHRSAPAKSGEGASYAARSWREVFTDPDLQKLIEEALAAGPDALVALARVREAEAAAGIARAPIFPNVALTLNTSPVARRSGETFSSSYLAGASITWEMDLWGRYRRANEAAHAEWLASEAGRDGVQASLIASIAGNYYQLAALREILAVTRRAADNQRQVLELVHRLSASGLATAAEERQQESALAATEARIPTLLRQIAEVENGLSLLLGRHPGAIEVPTTPDLAIPGAIPAGLPSGLIEQRPDIRQAEAQLVAANARVGEAKAMFFPSLSLTAILGGVSTSLGDLVNGRAPAVASIGPGLLQPLFAGGQLYFNREAALARLERSLHVYRKTILNALGEVANALTAFETSAELLAIQERRVRASREAMRLADLRFRAGTTSFLEVLDAQRQLLAAETEQAQSLLERRAALVNIYLALGGGWDERRHEDASGTTQ